MWKMRFEPATIRTVSSFWGGLQRQAKSVAISRCSRPETICRWYSRKYRWLGMEKQFRFSSNTPTTCMDLRAPGRRQPRRPKPRETEAFEAESLYQLNESAASGWRPGDALRGAWRVL